MELSAYSPSRPLPQLKTRFNIKDLPDENKQAGIFAECGNLFHQIRLPRQVRSPFAPIFSVFPPGSGAERQRGLTTVRILGRNNATFPPLSLFLCCINGFRALICRRRRLKGKGGWAKVFRIRIEMGLATRERI